MPGLSWVLVDAERDVFVDQFSEDAAKLGLPGCRVTKRTCRGGLRDGVDVLELDNGAFRFALLPTRGMSVWKGWLGDQVIGWKSPIHGPVHPKFVDVGEPSGLGWLDGFDELLCRCGLSSNGAPDFDAKGRLAWPLHGRIANLPAHRVEVAVDEAAGDLVVTGEVDECRFHFQKLRLKSTLRTRPGERGFRIVDEVTNLSATQGEMQILYHVNLGQPLLDPGARLIAPVRTVVPRNARAAEGIAGWMDYPNEQPGFVEQVYLTELLADAVGRTQTLLRNAHGTQGVSLRFNVNQLPCFTLWKDTAATQDGYVTGIEPGTNYPNPRTFEKQQGRVRPLQPGETVRFELGFEVHPDADSVREAEQAVAKLAGNAKPKVFDQPQPGWVAPEAKT